MGKYILLVLLILNIGLSQAQCNGRYESEIFTNTITQTVTYSQATQLELDIYMGDGDTETNRPLVILAHGGAFVSGNKTNDLMVTLAETLAKRGYVVASISYRLMSILSITQPEQYIDGVVKGMNDGRAAIRYFYKSVEDDGNPYGIDTTQIFFCGNSAGGVIGLHAAFLDDTDSPTGDFLTAINANGGIEGDAGNPGYSSKLAGVISLAGGIADVNFITTSDIHTLLISAHGDNDDVVPFNCGQPLGNNALPQLCGAGAIDVHTSSLNYTKHFHQTYANATHCPWNSNTTDEISMTNFVLTNLYDNLSCHQPVSLTENNVQPHVDIYPNPSSSYIEITSDSPVSSVDIYSATGQRLFSTTKQIVNLEHLTAGIYLIKVKLPHTVYTTSIIKQ